MTSFAPAILVALMRLPVSQYPTDETPAERELRMAGVAVSIDESSAWAVENDVWKGPRDELVGMQIGIGFMESGYAEHVHADRCRLKLGECDPYREDGVLKRGAIGPWQIHRSSGIDEAIWKSMAGASPEKTRIQARQAAIILGRSRGRAYALCDGSLRSVAAMYGWNKCTYPGAATRAYWARVTWLNDQPEPTPKAERLIAEVLKDGR